MSIEYAPSTDRISIALYTITQTAEFLQVSTRTIHRWIKSSDLIAHRFGHQWRISNADLQTFIRMRREA